MVNEAARTELTGTRRRTPSSDELWARIKAELRDETSHAEPTATPPLSPRASRLPRSGPLRIEWLYQITHPELPEAQAWLHARGFKLTRQGWKGRGRTVARIDLENGQWIVRHT